MLSEHHTFLPHELSADAYILPIAANAYYIVLLQVYSKRERNNLAKEMFKC